MNVDNAKAVCKAFAFMVVLFFMYHVQVGPIVTNSIHMPCSYCKTTKSKVTATLMTCPLVACTTEPVYLSCPLTLFEVFMHRSHENQNISI
jgi:hypothetical protein